jgi:hypothetical protein
VELAERGRLDYLVFECLAERTIALAQQRKSHDPDAGYDPLLAELYDFTASRLADLDQLEHLTRSVANRLGAAIVVVGLLLSSALLARVHDLQWMAFAGFCLAVVLGVYLLLKIVRTPGEL